MLSYPGYSEAKVILSSEVEQSRAHIRLSPESESLLKAAFKAEQSRDWRGAAENYQKALELYPQYLVSQSALSANPDSLETRDLYWGVQYYCRSALARFPAEGRQAYNELFGRMARHAFDNAVKGRIDPEGLEQLGSRYALTESGWRALLILMRWHLERGDSYKALGFYRELERNYPSEVKELPEFNLIGGFLEPDRPGSDWPTYAGDNTRSRLMAVKAAEKPDGKHAFSWAGYFNLPEYAVNLFRRGANVNPYAPQVSYEFIPFFPIAHKNTIYLPTGSGIYSLAAPGMKKGAEAKELAVKWKVEYETSNPGFPEERTINTATISADGKRLYAPLISSFAEHDRPLSYLDVKYPFPRRTLFCFDTVTAKALWNSERLPYFNGESNACEDVIFPVAPAEENGIIYIAGLRMPNQVDIPEHYIFTINARTGVVYSKTFIGSGILETNMFNNPSREPIVSAVTVDRDNVYYCSHIGVMTAVDKYSGIIKWSKKYEEYRIPTNWPDYTPSYLPLRWVNNPIIRLSGAPVSPEPGQVLFAAVDSPFLYLLSAENGRELWRWNGDESNLGNTRYLLGVKDGMLVISGAAGLVCLNLNIGGKLEWAVKDRRFVGKGALAGDKIYITENYTLLEIDLKTGKLSSINTLQGREEPQSGAHVLIAGDFLIRSSIGHLNLYRIGNKKAVVNEKIE